jgi:hypothetical protein
MFPWMNRITPRLPRIFREKADSAGKGKGPFVVGLLNGFMPCGPLQACRSTRSRGQPYSGRPVMFFFQPGTLPLMFGLGAVMTMLGRRFTKKMIEGERCAGGRTRNSHARGGLVLSGVDLPFYPPHRHLIPVFVGRFGERRGRGPERDLTLAQEDTPISPYRKAYPSFESPGRIRARQRLHRNLSFLKTTCRVNLKAGDNIIEFTRQTSGGKILIRVDGNADGTNRGGRLI